MSNITTKQNNMPAPIQGQPHLSTEDLVIPRILLMQATSDHVKKKKAHFGDIIESAGETVIGSAEKPVEIIPFSVRKIWNVYKGTSKTKPVDREYLRTEEVTAQNENLPYDDMEDGFAITREKVYNVYCLLPDDLMGLPYVLALKRTSTKVAKAIVTQMYFRNAKAKLPPYASVIEIGTKEEAGENGSYMVFTAKVKRLATEEEKTACQDWLNQIAVMKEDVDEEVVVATKPKKDIPNRAPVKKDVPTIDENEPLPF